MIDDKFILVGTCLSLIGSVSYAISTIKGKTHPNRVTWLLWAVAPLIAFSAQIQKGVGLQALLTFASGFGPAIVFVSSLINRSAYWRVTKFDYVCGALSLLALTGWIATREGIVAIALSIAADALAALPTVIKAYRNPASESSGVFAAAGTSALITLLTITTWNFENYAFALYIFLICALLFALIRFPRRGKSPIKTQTA